MSNPLLHCFETHTNCLATGNVNITLKIWTRFLKYCIKKVEGLGNSFR